MNQRTPRPGSWKSEVVLAARSAGASGDYTRRQVFPNAWEHVGASDEVEEMNEDCHLDSLIALPRQDTEQTTATGLNKKTTGECWVK